MNSCTYFYGPDDTLGIISLDTPILIISVLDQSRSGRCVFFMKRLSTGITWVNSLSCTPWKTLDSEWSYQLGLVTQWLYFNSFTGVVPEAPIPLSSYCIITSISSVQSSWEEQGGKFINILTSHTARPWCPQSC